MKKAILTIGLFSLVMVTTPFTVNAQTGSQSAGGNKKVDEMPKPEPSTLDKIVDWWNSL